MKTSLIIIKQPEPIFLLKVGKLTYLYYLNYHCVSTVIYDLYDHNCNNKMQTETKLDDK